jgi:hypothetical protein
MTPSPVAAQTLKGAVVVLKHLVPLAHPVRVTRAKMDDSSGDCDLKEKPSRFHIRIDSSMDELGAIETLIHEWAHARAWVEHTDDHSPYWGVAFSECYRALYDN